MKISFRLALPLVLCAAAVRVAVPATPAETLQTYAQPGLQDMRATIAVVQKSDPALREIGDGFEKGYRFKKSDFILKEPGKVRVEGTYGLFSVLHIINGDRKLESVPTLHLRKVKNIAT